jgi:hypothetical protein
VKAAVLDDHYDRDWKDDAVAAIISLSLDHETFSADDLRKHMREPNRPAQWGAAFTSARAQGLIESAGYKQSATKTRNSGSHQIWRRKTDRSAAA